MTEAVAEIRDVLAGRPGGVNRLIRRYGKAVVDYCTALIPDRKAPFDRMVEDVLVDILAQSRAAARSHNDDEVFEFAVEAALRTVRSRYREVLDSGAQPSPLFRPIRQLQPARRCSDDLPLPLVPIAVPLVRQHRPDTCRQ
jgi:hypothetical protein